MTLSKQRILEVAFDAVETYVSKYNDDNESQVSVSLELEGDASDNGCINIDGGHVHGAWVLLLGEL
jgi:hypothetical protein